MVVAGEESFSHSSSLSFSLGRRRYLPQQTNILFMPFLKTPGTQTDIYCVFTRIMLVKHISQTWPHCMKNWAYTPYLCSSFALGFAGEKIYSHKMLLHRVCPLLKPAQEEEENS